MTDVSDSRKRSAVMRAAGKSRDTEPELKIRRAAMRLGLPFFRLGRVDLPGKPDLVLPGPPRRPVRARMLLARPRLSTRRPGPAGQSPYWTAKIGRDMAREHGHAGGVAALGMEAGRDLGNARPGILKFFLALSSDASGNPRPARHQPGAAPMLSIRG